jgi:O-antigen/teichoic acid export membrane protein
MKATFFRWVNANRVILANASSLISSQLVTSVLGFVYWWLAARQFAPSAVGLASAAISAMMLLGSASVLGLGTLLVGELPRQPGKAPSLIAAALVVAGIAGSILGFLFALVAPALSADLRPLGAGIGNSLLFAAGVGLTTFTLVLDQALIGLLRGEFQLWRNGLFALIKLLILAAVGLWVADRFGLLIYATWVLGSLGSLVYLAVLGARRGVFKNGYRPEWGLLRKLGRTALAHHALNLTLQVPGLALPVLVTVELSATANAHFYVAWMVVSLLFVAPYALTTVLYAVSSAAPDVLAHKLRQTLALSYALGVLANLILLVGADIILGMFGGTYAEAAPGLHILALGVIPLIIRYHYVVLSRIQGRAANAAMFQATGSGLELTLAAGGAALGGLIGLEIGWLIALCVEAIFMAPTVYRVAGAGTRLDRRQTASGPADSAEGARLQLDSPAIEVPEGV